MSKQALAVAAWHADKASHAYGKAQYHMRHNEWDKHDAAIDVYCRHIRIADQLRCE